MVLTAEQRAAGRAARWNALTPEQQRQLMDKRNQRDQLRKAVEKMRAEERERFERMLAIEVAKASGRAPEVAFAQDKLRQIMALVEACCCPNDLGLRRLNNVLDRDVGVLAHYQEVLKALDVVPHCFEREALTWFLRVIDGIHGTNQTSLVPAPFPPADVPAWLLAYDTSSLPADEQEHMAEFKTRLRAFLDEDAKPSDRRRFGELLPVFLKLRRATAGTVAAELYERAVDQIRRVTLNGVVVQDATSERKWTVGSWG